MPKRSELNQAEAKKQFIHMLSRYLRRKDVEVIECRMSTEPVCVGANHGGFKVFAPAPTADIYIHVKTSRDVSKEWDRAMRGLV